MYFTPTKENNQSIKLLNIFIQHVAGRYTNKIYLLYTGVLK